MLSPQVLSVLQTEIKKRRLPDDFLITIQNWYLPLAEYINDSFQQHRPQLMVSFNGAQGSGKSTLTAFLSIILDKQYGLNSVELSIDDFYLRHAERQQLAKDVHPLLSTRGVPGTHDVKLAQSTLSCLANCSTLNPCRIPRFDKSLDDRAEQSAWTVIDQPVDIILFEGWCNHSPVQKQHELVEPVNELERNEDAEAVWRTYANDQLTLYHRELFDQADLMVLLQVPGFEKVFEWRGLQEKKLSEDSSVDQKGVMNNQQLKRFIQHYERITRHGLKHLPDTADAVLTLNEQHAIESIHFKRAV